MATLPLSLVSTIDPGDAESPATKRIVSTKPLSGPLSQAHTGASSLGRLRHRQGYDIQEVLYGYVKLRQGIWLAMRGNTVGLCRKDA